MTSDLRHQEVWWLIGEPCSSLGTTPVPHKPRVLGTVLLWNVDDGGPPEPPLLTLTLASAHRSQRGVVRTWLPASSWWLCVPDGALLAYGTLPPPVPAAAPISLLTLKLGSFVPTFQAFCSLCSLPGTPRTILLLPSGTPTLTPAPSHCCLSSYAARVT